MKSLQDNYNLIKEGKGSKELFLKQVRREFPQYISNVNTFNQVTANLKTRGIISETLSSDLTSKNTEPNWFNIFKENVNEAKATEKKVTKEVKDLEEKNFDYKDTANADNLIGAEILTGFYAEMKDPKNLEKTVEEVRAIVIKNLSKDALHYVKDGQFGVKGLGYVETPTKEAEGEYKSSGYGTIKESYNKDVVEESFDDDNLFTFGFDLDEIQYVVDYLKANYSEQDYELHVGRGDTHPNSVTLSNPEMEKDVELGDLLDGAKDYEEQIDEIRMINDPVEIITKKWPYVEFKDGETLHKVEFEYGDMIDDHGNEGQDQYWVGEDENGQEFELDVYADYQGNVQDVHYDTITRV